MKNVDDITYIFGDDATKEKIKEEIGKIISQKFDLTVSDKLVHRIFKHDDKNTYIKCVLESKVNTFRFKVKIKNENDRLVPELLDEVESIPKKEIYLLIIGNGFSRAALNDQDDPFKTENLCEKFFAKYENLKYFFYSIDRKNMSYEDKIGLLLDLIKYSPKVDKRQDLIQEYDAFVRDLLGMIFEKSRTANLEEIKSFCDFLLSKKPHVATLNYDQIIYKTLFQDDSGTRKSYTDGFTLKENNSLIFDPNFLRKKLSAQKKLYLHLHGSCMLHKSQDSIQKKRFSDFNEGYKDISPLVVLTSGVKKYSAVHDNHDFSFILHAYNKMLEWILKQCDKLIILGYGASDLYLNESITQGLMLNKRDYLIHFIETYHDSNDDNFEKFKNFIKKSPLNTSSAQRIIDKMHFNYFNQVKWEEL